MCKAIKDIEKRGEKRGKQEERAEMARDLVRFMREKALPEDLLREFLVQRKFSSQQIAELCAVH